MLPGHVRWEESNFDKKIGVWRAWVALDDAIAQLQNGGASSELLSMNQSGFCGEG